jgi:hypothetical protein
MMARARFSDDVIMGRERASTRYQYQEEIGRADRARQDFW